MTRTLGAPPASACCWKCKKQIDATDFYCRCCGAGQGSRKPFYYKLWGAWVLFFFIGPFNLYFLLRSPLISKTAKIISSAIFGLLTWWVCHSFYGALRRIFEVYSSLLNMPF